MICVCNDGKDRLMGKCIQRGRGLYWKDNFGSLEGHM